MTERVQRILVTTTCVMALAMHVPGPAGAQETLTLEDAIARGLKHSARLAELQARQEGSAAVQAGRAAAKLPIVAAQAGYTRTNHVDPYVIISPGQGLQTLYPERRRARRILRRLAPTWCWKSRAPTGHW